MSRMKRLKPSKTKTQTYVDIQSKRLRGRHSRGRNLVQFLLFFFGIYWYFRAITEKHRQENARFSNLLGDSGYYDDYLDSGRASGHGHFGNGRQARSHGPRTSRSVTSESSSSSSTTTANYDQSFLENRVVDSRYSPKFKNYTITIKDRKTWCMSIEDKTRQTNTDDAILVIFNNKKLSYLNVTDSEAWLNGTLQNVKIHPVFVDLPGVGLSEDAPNPEAISGMRGWSIFVHGFFRTLMRGFGAKRNYYLLGFSDAGDFLAATMMEAGIFYKKGKTRTPTPQEKKQIDMFKQIKILIMDNTISKVNDVPAKKLARFETDRFAIFDYTGMENPSVGNLRYSADSYVIRQEVGRVNAENVIMDLASYLPVLASPGTGSLALAQSGLILVPKEYKDFGDSKDSDEDEEAAE